MTCRSSKLPFGAPADGFKARGGTDRSGLMWQVVDRDGPAHFESAVPVGTSIYLYHAVAPTLWVGVGDERRVYTLPREHVSMEIDPMSDLYALAMTAKSAHAWLLDHAADEWRRRGGK